MTAIVWYMCYMYGVKPLDVIEADRYLYRMAHPRMCPPLSADQAEVVCARTIRLWQEYRGKERKAWFDFVKQALMECGHDSDKLRL